MAALAEIDLDCDNRHPLARPKAVTVNPSGLGQAAAVDQSNGLEEDSEKAETHVSRLGRHDTALRFDPVGAEDRRKPTSRATGKNVERDMMSAAAVATRVPRDGRDGETLAARPLL